MHSTTSIEHFFTNFVTNFAAFDGSLIATRYRAPYVAISATGEPQILSTHTNIAQYFDGFLTQYQAQGCRSCAYQDLQISPLSPTQLVASVTWQLFDSQNQMVNSWRESYLLILRDLDWKIVISIDHD